MSVFASVTASPSQSSDASTSTRHSLQHYKKRCKEQEEQIKQLISTLNCINEDHEKLLKKYENLAAQTKTQTQNGSVTDSTSRDNNLPKGKPPMTPEIKSKGVKDIARKSRFSLGSLFRRATSNHKALSTSTPNTEEVEDSVSKTNDNSMTLGVIENESQVGETAVSDTDDTDNKNTGAELVGHSHSCPPSQHVSKNQSTNFNDNQSDNDASSRLNKEAIQQLQHNFEQSIIIEEKDEIIKQNEIELNAKSEKINNLSKKIRKLEKTVSKMSSDTQDMRKKLQLRSKELTEIAVERNNLRKKLNNQTSNNNSIDWNVSFQENPTQIQQVQADRTPSVSLSLGTDAPMYRYKEKMFVSQTSSIGNQNETQNHTFMSRLRTLSSNNNLGSPRTRVIDKTEPFKKLANSLMVTIHDKDDRIEKLEAQCQKLKEIIKEARI